MWLDPRHPSIVSVQGYYLPHLCRSNGWYEAIAEGFKNLGRAVKLTLAENLHGMYTQINSASRAR